MRKRSWNTAGPQRGHFSAPLKKPCSACVTVSVCSNGCSCSTFITIIMRRRVLIASIKAFCCLDVCPSADVLVLCEVPTCYTRATFKSWPCEINKVYVSFYKHIFPSPRHKDHMKPPYFAVRVVEIFRLWVNWPFRSRCSAIFDAHFSTSKLHVRKLKVNTELNLLPQQALWLHDAGTLKWTGGKPREHS